MVHRRLVYIYLLNVPSFSSRYFNKIKRTSRLGRLLALSLEILSALNVMAIRVQRHTNVSKQATLLDGLDVSPLKWRVCGCG